MPIEEVPLALDNVSDSLAVLFNEGVATIVNDIRAAENGEIRIEKKKGTITMVFTIEASKEINGFNISHSDPVVKRPKRVHYGKHAVERNGELVVSTETEPQQVRLINPPRSN